MVITSKIVKICSVNKMFVSKSYFYHKQYKIFVVDITFLFNLLIVISTFIFTSFNFLKLFFLVFLFILNYLLLTISGIMFKINHIIKIKNYIYIYIYYLFSLLLIKITFEFDTLNKKQEKISLKKKNYGQKRIY